MAFGIKNDFESNLGKGFESVEAPIVAEIQEEVIADTQAEPTIEKVDEVIEQKEAASAEKELTPEQIVAYFKKNGRDVANVDDLFQVKEVNKYEGLIDEEDDAYFKYKKETGRTRKDFDYLKEDFTKVSALELAIERVRIDNGVKLTEAEAIEYLEDKLGIDLSDAELSVKAKIELNGFAKSYRDKLIEEQEKYRTPLEKITQAKRANDVEMVQLEDGTKVLKADFDAFTEKRNTYLNNIEQAVNRVTASDFKVVIDDNGEKKELNFSYEYSKDDKHRMLSEAQDVDLTINKRYQSKDGFNHQGLTKSLWWGVEENQLKVISAAMQQARAQLLEEMVESDNNVNFGHKPLQTSKKVEAGYGSLSGENANGFGVKFSGFGK
jgi:hypothetical protein